MNCGPVLLLCCLAATAVAEDVRQNDVQQNDVLADTGSGMLGTSSSITRGLSSSLSSAFGGGGTEGRSRVNFTPGKDCDRICDGRPKTCYYNWNVELYSSLTAACRNCTSGVQSDCLLPQCVPVDGFSKPVITVNRAIPGPPIAVCSTDTVVVDVVNRMADVSTAIHWHGIRQEGTPYMDGVASVSQCPIPPGDTFRYTFKTTKAGTFFWHSHIGAQKLEGLEGALIVRDTPAKELHGQLYDEDRTEHVIVVQDWVHRTAQYWTPGLHVPENTQVPDAVLIHGRGPRSVNATQSFVPLVTYTVEKGKRYRFRVIGATCMTCAYALRIQSHRLTVISADGGLDVKGTPVDSIAVNSADRFDFILNANQTEGSYYVYVQTLNTFCRNISQIALLQYKGSNSQLGAAQETIGDLGLVLNVPGASCNETDQICVSQLTGDQNAPKGGGANGRYMQIPLAWGLYLYTVEDLFAPGTYQHYEEPVYERYVRYTINNISFAVPPSPLQTQFADIPEESFCQPACYRGTAEKACYCTSYYSIPLNTVVDMFVYDTVPREDSFSHPFHLHGNNFFVLKQGLFSSDDLSVRLRELDALREAARTDHTDLRARPMKDTISVPAGGYAVLRFTANNPGWWFLHCHFLFHLESGMATVFKVGNDRQMPKTPRNFPRCGNYLGS